MAVMVTAWQQWREGGRGGGLRATRPSRARAPSDTSFFFFFFFWPAGLAWYKTRQAMARGERERHRAARCQALKGQRAQRRVLFFC